MAHACARPTDGNVRCWGWNMDGEVVTSVIAGGTEQQWEPTIDVTRVRWVVVYASTEAGGPRADGEYLMSAPLWLNNR